MNNWNKKVLQIDELIDWLLLMACQPVEAYFIMFIVDSYLFFCEMNTKWEPIIKKFRFYKNRNMSSGKK